MKELFDRIRLFRGKPVYEILCKTKESHDSFFVCYREYIDGKKKARNMDFRPISGYTFSGYPEKKMWTFPFKNTPNIYSLTFKSATENDIKPLTDLQPDFIYTFRKCVFLPMNEVFKIFRIWQDFPKMELLLNMNLRTLATDRTFLKMDEKNKKKSSALHKTPNSNR